MEDMKTGPTDLGKSREAEMVQLLEERRVMQDMLDAALENQWTRAEPGEYREAIAFIDRRLAALSASATKITPVYDGENPKLFVTHKRERFS